MVKLSLIALKLRTSSHIPASQNLKFIYNAVQSTQRRCGLKAALRFSRWWVDEKKKYRRTVKEEQEKKASNVQWSITRNTGWGERRVAALYQRNLRKSNMMTTCHRPSSTAWTKISRYCIELLDYRDDERKEKSCHRYCSSLNPHGKAANQPAGLGWSGSNGITSLMPDD